jgi:sugar lactone lactonase YvrE
LSICFSHTVTWNAANAVGGIKISPDGKKMAAAILGENAFELYDFDAATGKVSNAITLQDSVKFANAYSVEFSPDSRILYLSATGYKKVHQIFLQGNTAEKLLENAIEIPFSQPEGNTSLQLGA